MPYQGAGPGPGAGLGSSSELFDSGSGAGSLIVRDYEGISAGIGGLRQVLSKSESTLDQLGRTQASLAANSEGRTTAASGERLAQLSEVQRSMVDVTTRALNYLDLANTEFRGFDDELGRRFFESL